MLYSNQEDHDLHAVLKVMDFVREKGRIKGINLGIYSFTENHQRIINLYYHIPTSDRTDLGFFGKSVEIAQINLPYKKRQTVSIHIETLSKINQKVKSTWSQETYTQ